MIQTKSNGPKRKNEVVNFLKKPVQSKTCAATTTVVPPAKRSLQTPQTILLAVTGMSPAILTETVWALACENPPVIPARVVVITTLPGKARIDEELFKPTSDCGNRKVWQALRDAVFQTAGPSLKLSQAEFDNLLIFEEPRLIVRRDATEGRSYPVEDIRTPADNETAADFILDEVRKITANADTTLIASLAGGRKTMGALLYAAMSLLGRPQDRLTHVLVSEPFEDPGLAPRFYFPTQPDTLHQHRTGAVHKGEAARILLADAPFVRLRELFPKQLGRYAGSFSGLVQTYAERIQQVSGPPEIFLDDAEQTMTVQGIRVSLAPREYALLTFLSERCRDGLPPYGQQKDSLTDLRAWLTAWGNRSGLLPRQREVAKNWGTANEDDLRKQLSSMRAKFKQAGLGLYEPYLLPKAGRGAFGIRVRLCH